MPKTLLYRTIINHPVNCFISCLTDTQWNSFCQSMNYLSRALAKGGLNGSPESIIQRKPSSNYRSIIDPFLPNNQLSHDEEWFFDIQKIKRWRKVSAHVSLRELRRLTWVDTFRKYIKPPFNRVRIFDILILFSLQGDPGTKGESGESGIRGTDGYIGLQGDPGANGTVGPQGPIGETGKPGVKGHSSSLWTDSSCQCLSKIIYIFLITCC